MRNHGLSEPCLSKLQESRKLMLFDVLTMIEGAVSLCSCAVCAHVGVCMCVCVLAYECACSLTSVKVMRIDVV